MTPDEYCKQKAVASGSSFYYSFLFLPAQQYRAIVALYAFCREVDDVVDECREPELARIKLHWWRQEIGNTFAGNAQHPVSKALRAPIETYNLALEHFLEIIDGMEMDLDHSSYASFKDLSLYCYRVACVVGVMAAEIFGYDDRRTLKYAHNLGMAFQLTNILRDVREDARRGRVYLPEDEMAQHGVTLADIKGLRLTDGMRELFRHQATRAHHYYEQAYALLPECDRYRQLSGLIMGAIYHATLKEIEKQEFPVFERRIKLAPLRKLWIAWTTVLKEKRRHRRALSSGLAHK